MTVYRPPIFVFSTGNLSGTVAAKNFLSLVNPVGSGMVLNLTGVFVSSESTGASASTSTLRGVRVSDVSGGTLQDSTAKFVTTQPDPVAEVRLSPTMTVGNQVLNIPPPTSAAASSNPVTQIQGFPPFILVPGEGFGLLTNAGDTAQRFNISVTWTER